MDTIQCSTLAPQELQDEYGLIMDSRADIYCTGKHPWVTEFIQGVTIFYRGVIDLLPIVKDIHPEDVVYIYDYLDRGESMILHLNHRIYMYIKKVAPLSA